VPGQPFDVASLGESDRQALDDAAWIAKALFEVRAAGTQGNLALSATQRWIFESLMSLTNKALLNIHNGWMIQLNIGTYDVRYPLRAIVTLVGYGANAAADAVYPITVVDGDGQRLTGEQAYTLHFDAKQLPPVDAFWSLTLYDEAGFFVANPIDRFALGDRDPLHYNADGSLDLVVSRKVPAAADSSNWLPAPTGRFKLIMRLYNPRREVLDGRWVPPPVMKNS
jgi:hypothetical protein